MHYLVKLCIYSQAYKLKINWFISFIIEPVIIYDYTIEKLTARESKNSQIVQIRQNGLCKLVFCKNYV